MTIWVDADACPRQIKAILFRAAERTGIALCLVANQSMQTPPVRNITAIQVGQGFDVADNEIVRRAQQDDLV
ncbi:MAG: YaiI/YqxD family protein, partial [Gammaproteobacteria bacterium]|nr:YaiI/YqxD family protein [Gammaproteobacteria bacterium]